MCSAETAPFFSAVRWIGDQNIPVLGIKFGEVGFLAEIAEESLESVAETILKGTFTLKPRMRLVVQVKRKNKTVAHETVLNDVVINKGALARLAHIETYIDDHYLTTYSADGLIIATPTGSTAYSLAAGGPVIHPEVPGIIMTPICPFTLTNRPLILPDTAYIKLRLEKGSSDIMLTFDGQQGLGINDRDEIRIKKGPHPINMIAIPGLHYFDILKAKLRWSGGRVQVPFLPFISAPKNTQSLAPDALALNHVPISHDARYFFCSGVSLSMATPMAANFSFGNHFVDLFGNRINTFLQGFLQFGHILNAEGLIGKTHIHHTGWMAFGRRKID